jgi:NAD(P)-dependent dehydrogenase (short-subunit alcohol dehydrogenase family)
MTNAVVDAGQFAGKCAVITGSTQGLGEATARLFAERGAAGLVICGRNAERGNAVARDLSAGGCDTHFVQAELGDVAGCRAVIAQADDAVTDRGTILDTSPELFDRMFALNTRAPFFLMQDAAKLMRRERIPGTVVNILSMASYAGQPYIAAYCGSKGALATLTRNAAFALLRDRIRVNGLNLGWMDTPAEDQIQRTYHNAPDDWLAKAEQQQPFGRLIKPAEVARAIAFLSSEESGLMTGSIIDFDQSVIGAYDSPPQPAAE